jgi:hypothetical protein
MNLGSPEGRQRFSLSPSEGERAGVRDPTGGPGGQSASVCRGVLSPRAGRGPGSTAVELRNFPRKTRRLLPLLPRGRRGLGRGGPNEFSCRRTPVAKTAPSPQPSPRSAGRGRSHAALVSCPNSTAMGPGRGVRTLEDSRGFRWMRSVGLLSPALSSKGGEGVPSNLSWWR